ncbi:MAG: ABC transporter ATP-binding protein/permease [Lachnospiraceae bacterium]|nr:ABC transporter ATP-binding protein/permease [Lachnospiraceae bacterium]
MPKTKQIDRRTRQTNNMSCYLKRYWRENTFVILCLTVLCGLQVGANMLMMQSFQGIIDRNMHRFVFWTLILSGVWFLIYGLTGVETFFRCRVIRRMNNAIRQDITEILLNKSYQSFHEQSVGEYLSWLTNDISQIEQLAWNPFFNCIRSAVTVVFSIIALLTLHWSLLAASIITTVIMLSVPKLFHRKMEHLGTVCARKQSLAVSRLKEQLAGYDVLRFFNQDQRFISDTRLASDSIESPKFQLAYIKGFISSGMGCINIVCQMLHVTLIGVLSVQGIILQGALTGGGNLCGNLSSGLGNMTQELLSMSSAKPYFEKISAYTENSAVQDGQAKTEIQTKIMQNGIAMNHVGFCYDKKTVVREFSACFKKGGKYALAGPSGCGKSTLLKLMLGCLPEYTGSIRLDDQEIRDCSPQQLWQQISYVGQDVFLFNTTILDNITLGGDFSQEQIWNAVQDSALETDLLSLPGGLDTIVGENGSCLSGGQKQRVAIARALIHNRCVLLIDEGTSALDAENAERIEKNLLSKPGLTLILVSHHLSAEQKKRFTEVFTLPPAGNHAF